jgi:hypothetical protein
MAEFRYLSDVGRNPPRLIAREQIGRGAPPGLILEIEYCPNSEPLVLIRISDCPNLFMSSVFHTRHTIVILPITTRTAGGASTPPFRHL